MNFKNKNIGFAITGSFCTFSKIIEVIRELVKMEANVLPILSFNSDKLDTRFGLSNDFRKNVEQMTGNKIINSIQDAEPIGPKSMTDIMVVAPCSGNTIAKLSNGIVDGPVTMAVKSHLRNERPVIIAVSTNDGLAGAAENIGRLLNRRNYYFVPFRQDNPITKPRSLVFDEKYIIDTIAEAGEGRQIQPMLL